METIILQTLDLGASYSHSIRIPEDRFMKREGDHSTVLVGKGVSDGLLQLDCQQQTRFQVYASQNFWLGDEGDFEDGATLTLLDAGGTSYRASVARDYSRGPVQILATSQGELAARPGELRLSGDRSQTWPTSAFIAAEVPPGKYELSLTRTTLPAVACDHCFPYFNAAFIEWQPVHTPEEFHRLMAR